MILKIRDDEGHDHDDRGRFTGDGGSGGGKSPVQVAVSKTTDHVREQQGKLKDVLVDAHQIEREAGKKAREATDASGRLDPKDAKRIQQEKEQALEKLVSGSVEKLTKDPPPSFDQFAADVFGGVESAALDAAASIKADVAEVFESVGLKPPSTGQLAEAFIGDQESWAELLENSTPAAEAIGKLEELHEALSDPDLLDNHSVDEVFGMIYQASKAPADGVQEAIASVLDEQSLVGEEHLHPLIEDADLTDDQVEKITTEVPKLFAAAIAERLKPKEGEKSMSRNLQLVRTFSTPKRGMVRTKDSVGIPAKFDDTKMIATAVISTPAIDRDWEIMLPAGCKLEQFAAGPAPWFFNHQQIPFPIGSAKANAKDPGCPVDVMIEKDHVWANCHFNQATPEAPVIYELWKIGHLGATSVGFQGLKYTDISGTEAQELGAPFQVRRWEEWNLVEISIVGVGANPEALSMHASRGHVNKMAIPETLKKWFSTFVVPRKFFPTTIQLPGRAAQSHKTVAKTPATKGNKAMDNGETHEKPGHALLNALKGHCNEMLKAAAEGLTNVELEDVSGDVMKFLKGVHEGFTSLAETHGEKYEGLEGLELPEGMDFSSVKDDAPEDAEEEEPVEKSDESEEDDIDEEEAKQYEALIKSLGGEVDEQEKQLAALTAK
jgi:hypothetical protein